MPNLGRPHQYVKQIGEEVFVRDMVYSHSGIKNIKVLVNPLLILYLCPHCHDKVIYAMYVDMHGEYRQREYAL
jgi:hypothetical protein